MSKCNSIIKSKNRSCKGFVSNKRSNHMYNDVKLNEQNKFTEGEFNYYFYNEVLKTDEEKTFLNQLSRECLDLLIFGGLITDYISGVKNFNDIDIVLVIKSSNKKILELINNYKICENKFGGKKLKIAQNYYDIWFLNDTWAFKNENFLKEKKLNKSILKKIYKEKKILVETCFFNCNSIAYSINEKRFFYNSSFDNFYKNKVIDIIFYDNPFPINCILKTLEYSKNYKFEISSNLSDFVWTNKELLLDNINDYSDKYLYDEYKLSKNELKDLINNLTIQYEFLKM